MPEPQLLTADQVEPGLLDAFLCKVYPRLKSAFLNEHGAWWHGSDSHRLVIRFDGQIAGYCGTIPTRTWIAGQIRSALWWVDMIIAPEFRGRGFQSLFDARVQELADLLLGFPNELAGKIHRKHGWGVREDMPIVLLPLWPRQVKLVCNTGGRHGVFLRGGARLLDPLATVWRASLARRRSGRITKLDHFDAELLSGIFCRTKSAEVNTTWRDASYFAWRFGAAPHPGEYSYYVAGDPTAPTHYLIARHVTQADGMRYARILDVFGDFNDTAALRDLIVRAVQDALAHGSGQITLLASRPQLKVAAQRLGFLLSAPVGFCWLSRSPEIMKTLACENYWTLADSDNDPPD